MKLFLASDGVWEFIENDELRKMALKANELGPSKVCEMIIERSLKLWQEVNR